MSHLSRFSSRLSHGKRHKYLQVRCDLQMASIYFFCMKTEFTGFSVLSYQLLGVKSRIYHKKCCHKVKFMFIYNSCITLSIKMYIVLLLFNFVHHCVYRHRFLLMGVVHCWRCKGISEVVGLVSNYIGIAPLMFIMVSKVQ